MGNNEKIGVTPVRRFARGFRLYPNGLFRKSSSPPLRTRSSNGVKKLSGKRKVKPKFIAVVNEKCTGCGGSPVCKIYCPVDNCIAAIPAQEYPLTQVKIDPLKCIGCKRCIAHGPGGLFLEGCPWDAITMIPTPQWEKTYHPLPY